MGQIRQGLFVYVTAAVTGTSAGKTINITAAGYYYFDGVVCVSGRGLKGDQGIPGPSVEIDGIIGNEVLNAIANGGLVRSGDGTSANPFTLGLLLGTTAGQSMIWNGTSWNPGNTNNIYNVDGTLTANRLVTMNNNILRFLNGSNSTTINNNLTQSIINNVGSGRGAFQAIGGTAILSIFVDNGNLHKLQLRAQHRVLIYLQEVQLLSHWEQIIMPMVWLYHHQTRWV